jgi:hypothetical protein
MPRVFYRKINPVEIIPQGQPIPCRNTHVNRQAQPTYPSYRSFRPHFTKHRFLDSHVFQPRRTPFIEHRFLDRHVFQPRDAPQQFIQTKPNYAQCPPQQTLKPTTRDMKQPPATFAQAVSNDRVGFVIPRDRFILPTRNRFELFTTYNGMRHDIQVKPTGQKSYIASHCPPKNKTVLKAQVQAPIKNGYSKIPPTAPRTQRGKYSWPDNTFPAVKFARQFFATKMSLFQLEKDLDKTTKSFLNLKTQTFDAVLGQALSQDHSTDTMALKLRLSQDLDELIHEAWFYRKDHYQSKLVEIKSSFLAEYNLLELKEQNLIKSDFIRWVTKFIKGRRLFSSVKPLLYSWLNDLRDGSSPEKIVANTTQKKLTVTEPKHSVTTSITVNDSASSSDMFDEISVDALPVITSSCNETDSSISLTELNEIRAELKYKPINKRKKFFGHTMKRSSKKQKPTSTPKQNKGSTDESEKDSRTNATVCNVEQAIHQPSMFNFTNKTIPQITRKIERSTQCSIMNKNKNHDWEGISDDIRNHTIHIDGPKLISIIIGGNNELDNYPTDYLIRVELPSSTITKTFILKLVETLDNLCADFIVEFVSIPNVSESIPWLVLINAFNQSRLCAVLTTKHNNMDKLINKLKQVSRNDSLASSTIANIQFLEEVRFFRRDPTHPYGI